MIEFDKFELKNGLRVLVHPDNSTPMAVVDVIYDVGARDEDPEKTGFAHLFEHLMFGGSQHIPVYDEPLQMAGGENNAFTTNDLTNYYCQLPAENLETAFWLESDRMLSLKFSKKSLEVQRKVVCEEFKEHYINKPYGDVWHIIREMAYTTHPYRWMTIGKNLKHIEEATLDDVKAFFRKHYNPSNAILVVAGNVTTEQVRRLSEKWFESIEPGNKVQHLIPDEPAQPAPKRKTVYADVPLDAFYKVWHIYPRRDQRYYVTDLITEILSGGGSSRLFQRLVKEQKLFSQIECYHFGSHDPGLLVIEGKLVKGVSPEEAEKAVMEEISFLKENGITEVELEKVKNKTESAMAFEDMSLMNRASSLAMYELLGDANLINTELLKYQSVTRNDILLISNEIFREENSSTLYYLSKQKS
ncbi:MAG TPA: pitrilysin family protein [Ferruginibacter sp.]|nr:pitrilysin family protein [Ferruginibacter sp.]HRO18150.1 pitrilysin family protein [Ferruginibacter sp.]HRQ21637.1 pitrilysin family protein [Ferruginibacter sp.]